MKMSENEVSDQLDFICESVDDLLIQDRKELLNLILGSTIKREKIREKASGVQIMVDDIPREIILSLCSFIQQKLSNYSQNVEK
jgi:ABC-type uncharacterized transport system permease subunit